MDRGCESRGGRGDAAADDVGGAERRFEGEEPTVRAGRSPEELAKEVEPSPNTIRKWATQADIDKGLRAEGLSTAERKELRALRRNVRQLEVEREILGWEKPPPDQRYASVPRPGVNYPSEAFGFVKAHQAEYRVATMCRVLEVSRSGYYGWLGRP